MPDLNLAERNVNTRAACNIEVFSLEKIKQHFDDSVALIMKQTVIARELKAEGKTEEAKDILRSQIVFIDSAFDFYMHELLKLGITNLFHGEWTPKTVSSVSLSLRNLRTFRNHRQSLTALTTTKTRRIFLSESYSLKV